MNKQFNIGDKVIVIGKYESDNFWVGTIFHLTENKACVKIGNQELSTDTENLEIYDEKTNWIEFYRNKYPNPSLWDKD